MDIESWKAQVRKGAAELAVLTALQQGPMFGLQILHHINDTAALELADGTIYPLLNRLQRERKIIGKWSEDPGATHPRKYYRLTREGRNASIAMLEAWNTFNRAMGSLLQSGIRRRA
jgi:PadR family transcriptional regulator, regulatory protein PadR